MLERLDKFHKTRIGYLVFGLVELAMAYGFVNWALASGDWWLWIIVLFLSAGTVQNFMHAIWRPR